MKLYILFFITIASLLTALAIIPLWLADIAEIGYQEASVDAYNSFMGIFEQWNTFRKEILSANT